MKAVITPFVQKELGVATFKVDQEVRKLVEAGRKFIMEPVPRELIEHMEDGLVVTEQTMATNEALQPFFNSDELFRRIGGIDSLVAWLRRKEGQCQAADRSWCDNHIVHAERDNSAVLLCWHHDNHYRMRGFNELKETLHNNRVNWILDVARQEMGLSNSHDLSIQELCWWAFMRNMMHLMPEEVCRISINKMKATPQDSGPLKEADIRPYDDRATAYVQMMEERAAPMRAKVCPVDVDSDPGMAHFKIPKLQSLKLPEYMDFVASRPCCGCGAAGAGAHIMPYIVRHSRLCAHDIYAIPLCQSCQRDIERDRDNWEKTHGRLAMHQRLFFDYALGVGAITSHSSSVR